MMERLPHAWAVPKMFAKVTFQDGEYNTTIAIPHKVLKEIAGILQLNVCDEELELKLLSETDIQLQYYTRNIVAVGTNSIPLQKES